MKKIISIAIAAVMCAGLALGAGCSHSHEFGDWQTLVPATCTTEGSERRDCKECEEYQIRELPMTDHTLSAVYSADGSKHWKECSVCHQHIDEGNHSFSGSYCSVCKYDRNGTGVLQYTLNQDGKSFSVSGVQGSAPEQVTVPNLYVGLPVTCIKEGAFTEQRAMKSIALPDQLTTIESGAFNGCTLLQTLHIPASVKEIGPNAIEGCTALASVTVDSGNSFYTAQDGVLYDAPQTKILFVPAAKTGAFEIPEKVTKVDAGLFSGCGLEKVVVGSQVTEIAIRAFAGCRSLKEFEVQGADTVIGKGALAGCTSLNKLVLANTWQTGLLDPDSGNFLDHKATGDSYIGYIFGADLYVGTGSNVPESLKTVVFTGGEKLRNYTFYLCHRLENVVLPASLQTLEDKVFDGCSFLQSVTIAETNTKYFSQNGIVYDQKDGVPSDFKFIPDDLTGEVVVPEGVTQIKNDAFSKRLIEKISLPASLMYIGDYAFSECTDLSSVVLPESSALVSIGDYGFYKCEKLRSMTIPAKVTYIGGGAFIGCLALSAVKFQQTQGWTEGSTPVEPRDLEVESIAAGRLTYSPKEWRRSA